MEKVIECAKTIKEYCDKQICQDCVFSNYSEDVGVVECGLTKEEPLPLDWELPNVPKEIEANKAAWKPVHYPEGIDVTEAVRRRPKYLGGYVKKNDNVEHPAHYTQGGIECIEALKAATTGLQGIEAVCTANAIKYLWRQKNKNHIEDLRKAKWYIDYLINFYEEREGK